MIRSRFGGCLAMLIAGWMMMASVLLADGSPSDHDVPTITLESLLDEMVSTESIACFPVPSYVAKQQTSYDRRSVISNTPSWHSNDDWSGFIRYEANQGRVEKVLFDERGPGVLTRIITTGRNCSGTLRIYLDDDQEATIEIPRYDISKFPADIPAGLIIKHEHYPTHRGSSFYLPIPYQKRCRITFDQLDRACVYHVNYRTYASDVDVETFTMANVASLATKLAAVSETLYRPVPAQQADLSVTKTLAPDAACQLNLPAGPKAVRTLGFRISGFAAEDVGQIMRSLIVKISFDGTQTVWAPLGDFAGAGKGAPEVDSYFLVSDGAGSFSIRFPMPYQQRATVELENKSRFQIEALVDASVSNWSWEPNTLYFHASWRQQRELHTNQGDEYNMATLKGRGVFRGDVLSLNNHTPSWYGEGDEHIWVDDDTFPSHFGCGTEDYYNTTYAPVHVFQTPFGGAPRADDVDSRGWNTFLRTRHLDAIPFGERFKFDFELLSWDSGKVDYASTVYWYGEIDSKALTQSTDDPLLLPIELHGGAHAGDLLFENSDFENGDLANWTAQGDAFDDAQPTFGDNTAVRGRESCAQQGDYWIGSFERYSGTSGKPGDVRGDVATGLLRSVEFTVKEPYIEFLVSGGYDLDQLCVALVVGDVEVKRETGLRTEKMRRVVWDVSSWQGQTAHLLIRDHSTSQWGVINADDFRYASPR